MSQTPEQPPLSASSSFTSTSPTTSTPTTATPDTRPLTSPPPRTPTASLTPSLPASLASPLPHPHPTPPQPTTTPPSPPPSPPPPPPPPPHTQPSRALAAAGHQQLAAALAGVHALLATYQRLSSVHGEASGEDGGAQLAATAQRQREAVEDALDALREAVAVLVGREAAEAGAVGVGEEGRVGELMARRDLLARLVAEGNADVLEFVGRLRGLQRSLQLFEHDSEAELRPVVTTVPSRPAQTARR